MDVLGPDAYNSEGKPASLFVEPAPESAIDEVNYNWVAMMTTVTARHALAMGYDRETIAKILIDLGNAILTQDCAENMGPFELEMLG